MKKSIKQLALFICGFFLIIIVLCGMCYAIDKSSDGITYGKRNLVGVWERDMSASSILLDGVKEVWVFGADGSFMNMWDYEKKDYRSWEYPKILASGNYNVFGSKITLEYNGVKEKWSYSIHDSNNELQIGKDVIGYKTFKRAD